MIDDEHSGIANILNLPRRSSAATQKVYPQKTPELTTSELLMDMQPLNLPKSVPEPKDEFGYTKKQNREIENYMTRPKLEKLPILRNNINSQPKKKTSVLDYIEKVKENYNDTGSENNRYVNKSLNKIENRTANKSVVTFDPTTQLFTDATRNIAFKDYHQAKKWNDSVNQEPTATPEQVNDLKGRLDNSRAFGYSPEDQKDTNRKQKADTLINKQHRRLI